MSMLIRLSEKDSSLLKFVRSASFQTLTKGKDESGTPYLQHIFRLHELLFGETCTGCPSEIPTYINRVKNFNTMAKTETKKSAFTLKKGVVIPVPGTSKAYSEHNLTDEIALSLIKQNPNRASLFEVVPENLNELLAQEEHQDNEQIVLFDREFTVEEAKELLQEAGLSTRASTAQGITKKLESLSDDELQALKKVVHPETQEEKQA